MQVATAADWIEDRLLDRWPGEATIVFHSIVLQYLSESERERFTAALHEAGEGADLTAPLAWLQMVPAGELTDVHLTVWPGGKRCLIARAGYHGDPGGVDRGLYPRDEGGLARRMGLANRPGSVEPASA